MRYLIDSCKKLEEESSTLPFFCVVCTLRSIRVSIPEDILRDIDLLIKIGRYNSRDEVIAKALNDLLSREFVRISRSRYFVKS
jgi:hypothetical protein